ncbi:MAG: SDR family oxidoreductase [Bacteroidota bacterium]
MSISSECSVVITGGSKGIGWAIAKVFARDTDHPIVLIARNEEDLITAKKELIRLGAVSVQWFVADVSKEKEIATIPFDTLNPGVLVNNAGHFLFKKLEHTSPDEFEAQFRVNTLSAFLMASYCLPFMVKQDQGLIVSISSRAGLVGFDNCGAYAMSKHALNGYMRSLRKEWYGRNLSVTTINLGQTYSNSWAGSTVDPKTLINPEDVGLIIKDLTRLSPQSVAEEMTIMPQGGEVAPF